MVCDVKKITRDEYGKRASHLDWQELVRTQSVI